MNAQQPSNGCQGLAAAVKVFELFFDGPRAIRQVRLGQVYRLDRV